MDVRCSNRIDVLGTHASAKEPYIMVASALDLLFEGTLKTILMLLGCKVN